MGVVFGDRVAAPLFPRRSSDLNSTHAEAGGAPAGPGGSFTDQVLLQHGDRILFAFQQGTQAGVVSKGKVWRNVSFEDGDVVKVNLNLELRRATPHELPEGHWCFDHAFAAREAERIARDAAVAASEADVKVPSGQVPINAGINPSGKAESKGAAPAKAVGAGGGGPVPTDALCRPISRTLKRADGQLGIARCALRFAAPRRRAVDALPIVPFVVAPETLAATPMAPPPTAPR